MSSSGGGGGGGGLGSTLLGFLHLFSDEIPSASSIKTSTLEKLGDGIVLTQLLNNLEPTYFESDSLHTNEPLDVTLKKANLNGLLVSLESFFEYSMGKSFELDFINIDRIAMDSDTGEILKLLELVILCAINSGKKEEVVNKIMSMSDAEQSELMYVINEVMSRFQTTDASRPSIDEGDFSPMTSPKTPHQHTSSLALDTSTTKSSQQSNLEDVVKELEIDKAYFQEQVEKLSKENRDLKKMHAEISDQLEKAVNERGMAIQNAVTDTMAQLERQHSENRKTENNKMAREIASFEHRLNEANAHIKKLQESNNALLREKITLTDQFERNKSEIQSLRDELQVSSHKLESMAILEAKYQRVQSRLEAAGDMQAQYALQEEQNTKNLEKIISLESQLSELTSVKQALNKYKEQVVELQACILEYKVADDAAKNQQEGLTSDLANAKEQIKHLNEQLKAQKTDFDALQAKLTVANASSQSLDASTSLSTSSSSLGGDIPPAIREKLKRLEIENVQLKSRTVNSSEIDDMKHELEIVKSTSKSNELKYLTAQKKIQNLEMQLRQVAESNNNASNDGNKSESSSAQQIEIDNLRKEVITLQETIVSLQSGANNNNNSNTTSESDSEVAAERARNEQLAIRNKKLEAFVRRAQQKIKDTAADLLRVQQQCEGLMENSKQLRVQLLEREKELKEKERMRIDEGNAQNRERRLMSAAFYSLGMEYHASLLAGRAISGHARAEQRSTHKSWLNQQRSRLDE